MNYKQLQPNQLCEDNRNISIGNNADRKSFRYSYHNAKGLSGHQDHDVLMDDLGVTEEALVILRGCSTNFKYLKMILVPGLDLQTQEAILNLRPTEFLLTLWKNYVR